MEQFLGKLIMKIEREGSRSKGPEYYLELSKPNEFGQTELSIRKNALLWQKDPLLHEHLNKDVLLIGESVNLKYVKLNKNIKSQLIIYHEISEMLK